MKCVPKLNDYWDGLQPRRSMVQAISHRKHKSKTMEFYIVSFGRVRREMALKDLYSYIAVIYFKRK